MPTNTLLLKTVCLGRMCLVLLTLLPLASGWAQTRPQETGPTITPERERTIRDSIRQRSRVRFARRDSLAAVAAAADKPSRQLSYEPDRALLMPAMERSAIFRIGIPRWAMRLGLQANRQDFESDAEYEAAKIIVRSIRSIRLAAYAPHSAYSADRLLRRYTRYIKRRPRHEPVLQIRAPGGGVQIHVKERRGVVKRISLLAYGDEGAAVIRVKGRFTIDKMRDVVKLLTERSDQSFGVEIDVEPN